MVISNIEPFSRGKGRVIVYLDNQFSFVLYKGELSKYRLETGMEITDDLYNEIIVNIIIPRAKKRGMNLLEKMDRTEADVRNKLRDSGYPDEAIDEAIDYLKSFKYIDDRRYANDYIGFKMLSMSRKQIERKLSEKGIPKDIIEDELNNAYEEENGAEEELIKKLIVKKCKDRLGQLEYAEKQKLFQYLYAKGFSIYDIEKVYNHLT